jgi:hypothetical protein
MSTNLSNPKNHKSFPSPFFYPIAVLYKTGLPKNTHLTPNAKHLNISVPDRTPPSQ